MKKVYYLLLVISFLGCEVSTKYQKSQTKREGTHLSEVKKQDDLVKMDSIKRRELDSAMGLLGLVDVAQLNPSIRVELKYSGENNFMRVRMYDRLDRAFLQKDVAERLARCQDYLSQLDGDLHLLIYDAVRPVSIQEKMWRALDSIPSQVRGMYVSNPKNKSLHNYGAAIDLTICDGKGRALDMGTDFDEFGEIAYPAREAYFLQTGELTQEQVDNRKLLRKVMRSQGFRNLPTEWWHFNACSRAEAVTRYKVVEKEP